MKNWLLLGLLLMQSALYAQVKNPVKWTMSSKQVSAQEFDLIFTADIGANWYLYSQFIDAGGPIPTSFTYETGDHFQLVGKAKETSDHKKEGQDPIFEMKVIKFAQKATFTQRVKVSDLKKPIAGYLTFMTCDNEQCLPPTDIDFNFELNSTLDSNTQKTSDKQN